MILAKNVYDNFGKVLLVKDSVMTEAYVERLKQYGITSVFITESLTSKAEFREKVMPKSDGSSQVSSETPDISEKQLCEDREIDTILKGETMIDAVKITNDILNKLVGRAKLPYITTNMDSYQFSADKPCITSQIDDNILGTKNSNNADVPRNNNPEQNQFDSVTFGSDFTQETLRTEPQRIDQIIFELNTVSEFYSGCQEIDVQARAEVTISIGKITNDLKELDNYYSNQLDSIEHSVVAAPPPIKNIIQELNNLRTIYITTKFVNDQMQLEAPDIINAVLQQVHHIIAAFSSNDESDTSTVEVFDLIRITSQDLNKLQTFYTEVTPKGIPEQHQPTVLNMIHNMMESIIKLESSYLDSREEGVNQTAHPSVKEAQKIIKELTNDLNQMESTLILNLSLMNNNHSNDEVASIIHQIESKLQRIETMYTTAVSQNLVESVSVATTMINKSPELNSDDSQYQKPLLVQDSLDKIGDSTITPLQKDNNIDVTSGPSQLVTKTLKELVNEIQLNKKDDYPQIKSSSASNIKELNSKNALTITNEILNNLTSPTDVNKLTNDRAQTELANITNSILVNLAEQGPVDAALTRRVKLKAYKITQEAMLNIREGIIRSESVSKVVYDILRDVISDPRMMQLLANIRGSSEELFTHSLSVFILSVMTGVGAEYPPSTLRDLGMAALLHDIGKVFVPTNILNKPGNLTDEEFSEMKRHTIYGYEMLKQYQDIPSMVSLIALQHHERIDGSGYPYGLKDSQIDNFTKIVVLADIYDAMSTEKVYRKRQLSYEVFEYIRDLSSSIFGKDISKTFLQNVEPFPIGSMVLLSNGEKAIVFRRSKSLPARPTVKVVFDQNGKLLNKTFERDLENDLTLFVNQVISK